MNTPITGIWLRLAAAFAFLVVGRRIPYLRGRDWRHGRRGLGFARAVAGGEALLDELGEPPLDLRVDEALEFGVALVDEFRIRSSMSACAHCASLRRERNT